MRKDPDNPKGYKTYIEAGELTIWRWLGLDRFFPAAYEVSDPFLRGVPRVRYYLPLSYTIAHGISDRITLGAVCGRSPYQ